MVTVCLVMTQLSLNASIHMDGQARLARVAGYIQRWFIRPK